MVPLAATDPIPWSILTDVAPCDCHVNVVLCPTKMGLGLAVIETETVPSLERGAGVEGVMPPASVKPWTRPRAHPIAQRSANIPSERKTHFSNLPLDLIPST